MDSPEFSPEFPTGKPSERRELQGPRPPPLKVRKDSHKIKKPPIAPQLSKPPQPAPHHRPPVIIYSVSPKVIHTNPSDFMTLVQRLTGSSSSSSSSSSPPDNSGAISPAARFATIEKTNPSEGEKSRASDLGMVEGLDVGATIERPGSNPGILSPLPSSLPPISPSFFSSLPDPTSLGFLHDLSPIFHGNRNFIEGTFMPSPSTFFSTPIASPPTSLDLFNQFLDF
ncbi:hypothetical protein HHK36_004226 [Tetracentron sinense]|uniref:VQ domain-containing protein n=1 Tax=Tetracentron sinense TaxID=13715 RepID=A0A834ZUV0_TETSI|nr:hypothetical protein HHK36_004226 [Tetracentron sinense]